MSDVYVQFKAMINAGADPIDVASSLGLSSEQFDQFIEQINDENEADLKDNFFVHDPDLGGC